MIDVILSRDFAVFLAAEAVVIAGILLIVRIAEWCEQ